MDLKLIAIVLVMVFTECNSSISSAKGHQSKWTKPWGRPSQGKRPRPMIRPRTLPTMPTTTHFLSFYVNPCHKVDSLSLDEEGESLRRLLCSVDTSSEQSAKIHEPGPITATTKQAKTMAKTTSTRKPWSVCHCPKNLCTARGGCENDLPCMSGWYGPFCEHECKSGFFGINCMERCPSGCHNNRCSHINGSCYSCKIGYKGDKCDKVCDEGFHGRNCLKMCPRRCQGNRCSATNGNCFSCFPGYRGEKCYIECPIGTWGINCSNLCSGHCVYQSCDHINGQCTRGCLVGNKMPHCLKFCDDGTWGINCSNICSDHCVDGQCDPVSGQCREGCQPGYTSPFCNQSCHEGAYGQDCGQNCSHSCIPSNTSGLPSCHSVDGTCLLGCQDGYLGPNCGDVKAPVVANSIQRPKDSGHVITIVSVAVSAALLAIVVTIVVVVL